jgi:predicted transcriptional regulator
MIMIFVKSVGGSIIRDVTIKVADEKDLEFVQGLESLGMKRTVACVITFLKDQKERSSRDIEVATGLRQPEVSIAMQTLRERGWITENEIKSNGKGRPLKTYALSVTINEIIKYYEEEKSREAARTSEAIEKLKELSSQKETAPS